MPFDGLTIRHLCNELTFQLEGQRIEKIYQPDKDELTLVIRGRKGSHRLLISTNARWGRMHITTERRDNPTQPSAFCMLLRKHLEGAKILAFSQQGFDRIVHIRIEAMNELMEWQEKLLICEFTGKNSNVVLVDPLKNSILDGIKRYGRELSSHRVIQPGEQYVPPPVQDRLDPFVCSYTDFYQAIWGQDASLSVSHALFQRVGGYSPPTCVQLCLMANIDPEITVGECGELELSRLYELACRPDSLKKNPTLVGVPETPVEYYFFLPVAEPVVPLTPFETLNEVMDHFYSTRMANTRLESIRMSISRNVQGYLDKAYRKLMFQEGDLQKAEKSDLLRNCGELLTTYGFQLKKGDTKATLPNFDGEGETTIVLQPHLNPQENARRYFKQYTRARTARVHLQEFIRQNRLEIEYLESVALSLEKANTITEIEEIAEELQEQGFAKGKTARKKQRPEPSQPRRFKSSDGWTILAGKNNRQNDLLTMKMARKGDLWLHTQGYAGTHVILQPADKVNSVDEIPIASLEEAAILAAHFSRGKEASRIPVDYTFRTNVKKPHGARPGMVVYDPYWTIDINPNDERLESLLASAT